MDIFEWIMSNGSVLNGEVIVKMLVVGLIFELFGIASYWIRRF